MAITIQATPAAYSSLQDDLIYTVAEVVKTGNPTLYPNYKFVADVYVNGVMITRIKKTPNPTTRIGIFNIGQVVRNYLALFFNPTANVLVSQQIGTGAFWLDIQMKFGEEYSYTTYTNLTIDSSRKFFNNYNGRLVGVTSSLAAFANKVASNRPTTGQCFFENNSCFIPYFPISTSAVNLVVTPYGGGNVYSTTFTPSTAYDLQLLNVAPGNLNAIAAGTINQSTTYYTVAIGSQTYRIDLICEPIYEKYVLHFLNKYGGFESKIFSKVSRKTLNIEKKDFGKLPYNVDISGVVTYKNANNVYNESRSVYASQYKEKLTLNSDFITDNEYQWLSDLILSPMVYIEDSGYYYPCVITENNYEPKKFINDELTNLTLSVEYGERLNAQYR